MPPKRPKPPKPSDPNKQKMTFVTFGPQIPLVPLSKEYWDLNCKVKLEDAWQLVGPTIDRNLQHINTRNMWKLYAIAFIEGMRMAVYGMEHNDESRRQELRTSKRPSSSDETGGIQELGTASRVCYATYPPECGL